MKSSVLGINLDEVAFFRVREVGGRRSAQHSQFFKLVFVVFAAHVASNLVCSVRSGRDGTHKMRVQVVFFGHGHRLGLALDIHCLLRHGTEAMS